ncbi:preprotein translocase subunit SecA, partial [Vibrio parahaemolyticus]|nr:preprotein translocase subunit SecA [Vibrio parahaemolyticus]
HELGGLHVIGTERHESRRVDNQLKGRAGRQGDPGSSQFFLSLEDEMIQRYAGEDVEKLKKSLKIDENGLILNNKIYDLINRTQLICEGSHFSMREYNLKLDDVINDQRNVVYKLRNNLLNEEVNMIEIVIPMIKNTLTVIAKDHLLEGMLPEEWDFTRLVEDLKAVLSTEE